MGLVERINEDLKSSMKAKDELRLSVVRMLKSAVKYREIEKGSALSDDDVIGVITTMIKQRRDSSEQYIKGGRTELANKEDAEIALLQGYLPEQLTEGALESLVKEAISESNATSAKDMGKVMKILMPKVKGKADGKLVNEKVKALLGG